MPINVFKNQVFLLTADNDSYKFEIPFPTYYRHIVKRRNYSESDLITILKQRLNPRIVNGLLTSGELIGRIQFYFSAYKVRYTQKQVPDVTSEGEQLEFMNAEHTRAHRNSMENKIQLLNKCFFPGMSKKIETIVKNCMTCKSSKYDRHPPQGVIQPTPIAEYPGQIIHLDLYSTETTQVLTAIDKFSKYA